MKSYVIFFIVIFTTLTFFCSPIFAQNETKIEVTKLTENMYEFVCYSGGFNSNVLAFTGEDGLLLVDCGYQQTGELLQKEVEKLNAGPVKYLILTHSHVDHTGAIVTFGKGATVIAHKNVKKDLTTGYNIIQDLPEDVLPNIEIEDNHTLNFNGEEINITYYPGVHSDGDVVIHFPKSKIVCVGGLLYSDMFPFISLQAGGSIQQVTKSYEKVIDMFPADTRFIASHGRDYNMDDMKNYHKMLVKTTKLIQKGLDEGKDVAAMQEEKILAENWSSWGNFYISQDLWIQTVANSLTGDIPAVQTKTLILEPLFSTAKEKDAIAVIKQYRELKEDQADDYDFGENNLNILGYYLLGQNRIKEAIEIFKLNVEMFPDAFNVYDSLGEGYMNDGQTELAIKNYEKSIELNPDNYNGIEILKRLKEKEDN